MPLTSQVAENVGGDSAVVESPRRRNVVGRNKAVLGGKEQFEPIERAVEISRFGAFRYVPHAATEAAVFVAEYIAIRYDVSLLHRRDIEERQDQAQRLQPGTWMGCKMDFPADEVFGAEGLDLDLVSAIGTLAATGQERMDVKQI